MDVRHMSGWWCVVFVALAVMAVSSRSVQGQERDPIAAKLSDARTAYESRLESVRTRIAAAIDAREKELRLAKKPDLAAIQEVEQARRAFIDEGAWPDVKSAAGLRQDAAKAAAAMKKAFAAAIAEYVKREKDELAGAVEEDLRVFSLHSDIVPWRENLVSPGADWSELGGEAKSLDLHIPRGVEYRLEVVARRTEGDGFLELDVPLPAGKALAMRSVPNAKGDVRVLLTVGEGAISADLGVERPLDLEAMKEGDLLSLRADIGRFDVRSVRVKPLVAGEPESLTPKPTRDPRKGDRTDGPPPEKNVDDWLPLKGTWRGHRQNRDDKSSMACTVKISRDGDVLVLHVDHGTRKLSFDCTLEGDRITLKGVRQTKGPHAEHRHAGGTGRVYADHIEVTYRWYVDTAKVKNELVEGTLSVKRDGT